MPARRLDLLLVNKHDRAPVLAEVKIAGDKHVFYALIQVLALLAEFASDPQRRRLASHYPSIALRPDAQPVGDVYVIALAPPQDGVFLERLLTASEAIAQALMGEPKVTRYVRRIAYLQAPRARDLQLRRVFAFGEGC